MSGVWDDISSNALLAGVVSTLVAALIITLVKPLRTPLVKGVLWVWQVGTQPVLRLARHPLHNVAKALYEGLQARHDPRAYLVCFYKRYREWRTWVQKVSSYLGKDVRLLPNYAEWRKYDDKWREELEQKVESPNLRDV